MKKLNRKSASPHPPPAFLGRPTPAPCFQPLVLILQIPPSLGEVIEIYSLPLCTTTTTTTTTTTATTTKFPSVKMLMKQTISVDFQVNCPKLCGCCEFPRNFHTRKLGEVLVFFALCSSESSKKRTTKRNPKYCRNL